MCVVSNDCNNVSNAGEGKKKQLKQSKNNCCKSLSNRSRRADTRTLTGTDTVHVSFATRRRRQRPLFRQRRAHAVFLPTSLPPPPDRHSRLPTALSPGGETGPDYITRTIPAETLVSRIVTQTPNRGIYPFAHVTRTPHTRILYISLGRLTTRRP